MLKADQTIAVLEGLLAAVKAAKVEALAKQTNTPTPKPAPKTAPLKSDTRLVLIGRICGFLKYQTRAVTMRTLYSNVSGNHDHIIAVTRELAGKGTLRIVGDKKYGRKLVSLTSREQ